MLDCLLPLSLVLSMNDAHCDSHRKEASVGAAPISGLARKHETQSLLKPDPFSSPVTVLKLTCNAVRTREKSIRNCCPCNYRVFVRCVVLCPQPALLLAWSTDSAHHGQCENATWEIQVQILSLCLIPHHRFTEGAFAFSWKIWKKTLENSNATLWRPDTKEGNIPTPWLFSETWE